MPEKNAGNERFHNVITTLQRLLEQERKKGQQLQFLYNKEVSSRTDLQTFLKQCIEDVQHEIERNSKLRRVRVGNLSIVYISLTHAQVKSNEKKPRPLSATHKSPRLRNAPVRVTGTRVDKWKMTSTDLQRMINTEHTLQKLRYDSSFYLTSFDASTRAEVLKRLLTKEQVLGTLYEQTFPQATTLMKSYAHKFTNPQSFEALRQKIVDAFREVDENVDEHREKENQSRSNATNRKKPEDQDRSQVNLEDVLKS
jgi:hypothetical protein